MTELSPEAVEVQAPPLERFRKRAIEVEMMLWDGTLERLVAIQQWIGPASDDPEAGPGFAGMVGPYAAELWVEHLQSWVSVPVGTRVAKEADGNGFYPISPMAIAGTFDPAPEPLELTGLERAAAAKSEHMATCHEPVCVDCMRELRLIRRIVKAIRPHIADEFERVADAQMAAANDEGYRRGWKDGYGQGRDDEAADAPIPVAAASNPTRPEGE